ARGGHWRSHYPVTAVGYVPVGLERLEWLSPEGVSSDERGRTGCERARRPRGRRDHSRSEDVWRDRIHAERQSDRRSVPSRTTGAGWQRKPARGTHSTRGSTDADEGPHDGGLHLRRSSGAG